MPEPIADSVRTALPVEAGVIAAIQRRHWEQSGDLGAAMLDQLDLATATELWREAITRPPVAQCRVLVAVDGSEGSGPAGRPVGYATTLPSPDADAEDGIDGMVEEFVIDPPARGRGHGSRLLNACVDTLRADGFDRATWWLASTDDQLRRFLTAAGWAPDGGHRELAVEEGEGPRLRQVRLHSDISPA